MSETITVVVDSPTPGLVTLQGGPPSLVTIQTEGPQGPQGIQGPEGPQGPQGPQGDGFASGAAQAATEAARDEAVAAAATAEAAKTDIMNRITYGYANPAGGVTGDIYFKIV
jgi:hypothetical protein